MKNTMLDSYLDYLLYQKSYSKYTVNSYKADIIEFLNYCKKECIDYEKIEYSDTRLYLMYLKDARGDNNS